tara:strand:- start:642 stop:776 length:135 start_codon:yes stop_codon:yes gene_type:complete
LAITGVNLTELVLPLILEFREVLDDAIAEGDPDNNNDEGKSDSH